MLTDGRKNQLRGLALTTLGRAKEYAGAYERMTSEELEYCISLPCSRRMKSMLNEYLTDAKKRELDND